MPAKANKSASSHATAAAPAKVRRLPYIPPWRVFAPTVLLFALLNYLAFYTTTDVSGKARVLPGYVAQLAATQGETAGGSFLYSAALFFEETVVGRTFQLGIRCFRSLFGIQAVCVGAWMIHVFELGVCTRICYSCHASAWTTARYMICTTLAGFAQLTPLMQARDVYVEETKAEAATAATGGEPKKSK